MSNEPDAWGFCNYPGCFNGGEGTDGMCSQHHYDEKRLG